MFIFGINYPCSPGLQGDGTKWSPQLHVSLSPRVGIPLKQSVASEDFWGPKVTMKKQCANIKPPS